jgi:hypothetical protein
MTKLHGGYQNGQWKALAQVVRIFAFYFVKRLRRTRGYDFGVSGKIFTDNP